MKKPDFLVQMQTMDRQDVITLIRQTNPHTDDVESIRIALQLDPTAPCEVTTRNPITETFGYIAISETDDTTDAILAPSGKILPHRGIYDLSGRSLQDIPKKGIYIVDGKKVVK
ncbi:MAG: hypothetical protein IJT11_05725 [Bacteroidaceae bacterium]|nr:hypothetical protein [Bacteroidaceae bacterium]